jgi:hypothetical protein
MIAPCLCRGSAKWVHRSCLNEWRATRTGDSFSVCATCKFHYTIRERSDPRTARQLWTYRGKVTRDCGALLAALIMLSVAAAELAQWLVINTNIIFLFIEHVPLHYAKPEYWAYWHYWLFGVVLVLCVFGSVSTVAWLLGLFPEDDVMTPNYGPFS